MKRKKVPFLKFVTIRLYNLLAALFPGASKIIKKNPIYFTEVDLNFAISTSASSDAACNWIVSRVHCT